MALTDKKLIEVCEIIARHPVNCVTTELIPVLLPLIDNEKERTRLALLLFEKTLFAGEKLLKQFKEDERAKKN